MSSNKLALMSQGKSLHTNPELLKFADQKEKKLIRMHS